MTKLSEASWGVIGRSHGCLSIGGDVMAMKTVTVLKKARALIKKGWTQGWFARDSAGVQVNYDAPNAKCFCVAGAVYRTAGDAISDGAVLAMGALTKAAPAQFQHSLSQYNDAPRRTQAQVLALFDRAIAKATK